ncbi:hypothetical protein ACMFMG_010435 [Clarireedia jacksonii]
MSWQHKMTEYTGTYTPSPSLFFLRAPALQVQYGGASIDLDPKFRPSFHAAETNQLDSVMEQNDDPKGERTPNDKSALKRPGVKDRIFGRWHRSKYGLKATRKALESTAHVPNLKSANSSQHSTGRSRAATEVSRFLETLLATADPWFSLRCDRLVLLKSSAAYST